MTSPTHGSLRPASWIGAPILAACLACAVGSTPTQGTDAVEAGPSSLDDSGGQGCESGQWRDGVEICDGDPSFTCNGSREASAECAELAPGNPNCKLMPPIDYWRWGGGGARMTDEQMQAELLALKRRPVPACLCTCGPAYRQQVEERDRRARHAKPPP